MVIPKLALAFACLSCLGTTRRVQPLSQRGLQNEEPAESQELAINSGRGSKSFSEEKRRRALQKPVAAFKPSAPGTRLLGGTATNDNARSASAVLDRGARPDHPPLMSVSHTLTEKPQQEARSAGTSAYELLMHTPTKTRARVDRIQTPLGTLDTFGVAPLGMARDPTRKPSPVGRQVEQKEVQAQVKGLQKDLEATTEEREVDKTLSKLEADRLRLEEAYRMEGESSKTEFEENERQFKLKKSEEESAGKRHLRTGDEQVETRTTNASLQVIPTEGTEAKNKYLTFAVASIIVASALTLMMLLSRKKNALYASPLDRRESEQSARIEEDVLERGQAIAAQTCEFAKTDVVVKAIPGEEAALAASHKEVKAADARVGHKAVAESMMTHAEKEVMSSLTDLLITVEANATKIEDTMVGVEGSDAMFRDAFAAAQAAEERKAAAKAKRDLLRLIRLRNRPRKQRRLRLLQMLRRMRLRLQRVQRMQRRRMFHMKRQTKEPKPLPGRGGNGRGPPRGFTTKRKPSQRYADAMLDLFRMYQKITRLRKGRRRR